MFTACAGSSDSPTAPVTVPVTPPKGPDPVLKGSLIVSVSGVATGASADVLVSGPAGFSRSLNTTGALADIDAGRYTISARRIRTADGAFDAAVADQTVDVIGGNPPITVNIAYEPAKAVVGVAVTGLPARAPANLTVTAPTGGSSNFTGSARITGPAGKWLVSAGRVSVGGYSYAPLTPSTEGTVLAGDSLSLPVQYSVATGAIAVLVTGLPPNASATYSVSAPGRAAIALTGTSTLTDLEPGQYTITAPTVLDHGAIYRPFPASQLITVSPSLIASAVVISYGPVTSALAITVTGAPPSAADMIRIAGPNNFSRTVTSSGTIENLVPGSYNIVGSDIVQSNATWRATPASLQRTLAGDATDSIAIAYAVVTGSISINISGLPTNASASVTVTGPGGFVNAVPSSGTLSSLAPGTYTVSAQPVNIGNSSYLGTPNSQTVNVIASLVPSTVTVNYRVRSASLVVRVDGAPANAQDMVRVTGPNGLDRTLTSTTSLDGLPGGSYTVVANDIVQPSAVWRATPPTVTRELTLDSKDTIAVNYAVSTGLIAVTISGLPAGVNANMQLSGPGGFLAPVTSTSTFVRLTPGVYALSGTSVNSGGTTYAPTPATQQIVVNASLTASGASVSYGSSANPNTASLIVAVTGAPNGSSPTVQITGPSNFTRTIASTTTFTALAPGTYSVSAASMTSGGSSYTASPSSAQRTLATGARDSVGITYSTSGSPPPATGQLAVTVSGLPGGTDAAISLTGPNTSRSITASTTVTGLTAGSYTLAASSVSSGGTTYNVSPSSQSPAVTAGNTTNATVTYTAVTNQAPSGDDLSVEYAYLTQATQRPDGSVPLVANRDALLRVFVKTTRANLLRPDVRVRIYDGSTLIQTTTIPAPETSVRTALAEGSLQSTWNTVIPAVNVRTGMRILADVDPTSSVATDDDRSNNVWPRGGTPQSITANSVPALNIRFVPVVVGALTGNVTTANLNSYLVSTRLMHPISTINADVRLPFTSSAPALQSNDGNSAWLTVLSEMNTLRSTDGAPSTTHYYGVVKVTYNSGVAGYGYVPGRAAVGWDYLPSGDGVAVHELGHNFSRPHTPCGVSGDASYPYAGGSIGYYGWNSTSNSLIAPTATDYMGYCSNTWTSDWTWNAVMQYRQSSGYVGQASYGGSGNSRGGSASRSSASGEGLLVWGRIVNGRVLLEPAFRITAAPTAPYPQGQFRVQALDATGATLFDMPIDAARVDHALDHDERQFAVVLPYSAALEQSLATVRVIDVRSPLSASARTSRAARAAGPRPDALRIQRELADPQARVERAAGVDRLRWNSAEYPMALVRDVATGQTIAFLRGSGDGYLARGRAVDVVLSDGVRSLSRRIEGGEQPQ